MKLIDKKWNPYLSQHESEWIIDTEEELTAGFAPDCACGSFAFVISTGNGYMKNSVGKWQKIGSTEVIE
jgi:hypothetical protein